MTRADIAQSTGRAFHSAPVGLYREGDTLYPIIARNTEEELRTAAVRMEVLQVQPTLGSRTLPLGQVTDGVEVTWEDPIIVRFQRRRQAAIQATPHLVTFPTLKAIVDDEFAATELPEGYSMFWDGEVGITVTAQASPI